MESLTGNLPDVHRDIPTGKTLVDDKAPPGRNWFIGNVLADWARYKLTLYAKTAKK
jgi:hypothetical protein